MKKIYNSIIAVVAIMAATLMGACSEFEPTGYTELPNLEKVNDLKAEVNGFDVNLTWSLPSTQLPITGLVISTNGSGAINLPATATSYTVVGQPMDVDYFYTVKVKYEGDYVSEGVSVSAKLPFVSLPAVTNLTGSNTGRNVTLSWTLPSDVTDLTAIRVLRDGMVLESLPADATTITLKSQPMDAESTYGVEAIYKNYYPSAAQEVKINIPFIPTKMGYLMTAATIQQLPDDDERAAASWFEAQENAVLLQPSDIPGIDPEEYTVIWIEIDREGLPFGWENLPIDAATIDALRAYSEAGGSLYLANMATQLTVPLGFVPDNMAPTVFGNGGGGEGNDVWVINPYLGWDFRNGADQGFYDRTMHAIYKGLTLEDPNGYGYDNLPLIGPGHREDHNCLWDCNIYGRGDQPDVIKNFEVTTGSLVLATWGHVRDHCVAGLVEFYGNDNHGRCIANGFAAYEWNQNSGTNPYQHNVEQLTLNILNYLK